ncbi:hypothetical protein SmJEL517_g03179 [Synchytrium microbalum]|uniref:NADP-dependent oxidoreductase domain-containing protein n=1 Tax=Synchytrium microbalum TaxID=1806994 RepID=A0A507C951_9FUNG|nr:uncharacterized protein SmJEL517_g03179 [Synchytrium microbalum]TPX34035.1 hypothetical protein SmJEL517_g03179 [Synchytrium microbalum]
MTVPNVILGTNAVGGRLSDSDLKKTIDAFIAAGYNELDSARIYAGGKSEETLGRMGYSKSLKVATKLFPAKAGSFSADGVRKQATRCLTALNVTTIDLLYLHFPDRPTPLEETCKAINELYKEGKIKAFGLSNYSAFEVQKIYDICNYNGYLKPTVYQGIYNPLSRDVEAELFPALKQMNIAFYAYSPLAGGLLTNRYSSITQNLEAGTRFSAGRYRDMFWKESYLEAVGNVKNVCSKHNIDIMDASMRWMKFHSGLDGSKGDGYILGGSSFAQMDLNIKATQSESKLPEEILLAFDEAYYKTKATAEPYFAKF